ncbi:MAG TPA: hypothetical protein VGH74_16670 [Planctomycetaceae bacterium]|jgi:hypothetical protein
MPLEPEPDSQPDDADHADDGQELLSARVCTLLHSFDEVMKAIYGLKQPEKISEAKEWVLEIVDELAEILEPNIDADDEDLIVPEEVAALDGPEPALLPAADFGMAKILNAAAADAKIDRFLAELEVGAKGLPEDNPVRLIWKILLRGRDLYQKARDVKQARDEFQAGLGLPPAS